MKENKNKCHDNNFSYANVTNSPGADLCGVWICYSEHVLDKFSKEKETIAICGGSPYVPQLD